MKRLTGKTIISVVVEMIVTALIFTGLMWAFGAIFDKKTGFDWSLLVQGALFAVIYVPFARRARHKKQVQS